MSNTTTGNEDRKDKVLNIAFYEGLKWGVITTGAGALATVITTARSEWFRKSFSISAKTSIPVMSGIFAWSLSYELTMNSVHRYPERWGLEEKKEKEPVSQPMKFLPIHHQIGNLVKDYPFQVISVLGFSLGSKILYDNLQIPHLTISQRIMHSRVMAQGGAIMILLSVMATKEFMDKRGRYVD